MRCTALAAVAAVTMAFASAVPVDAQQYRFDVGVHGGFAWWTDALDGEDVLLGDGVTTGDFDARFDRGWLTGAQATAWLTPRLGLRANFGYTERPLEADNGDLIQGNLVDDVNLWSGSGDLMFRFLGAGSRNFLGTAAMPYLALGGGAKWINPARNDIDGGSIFVLGGEPFLLEESTKAMGLVALGSDFRVARNLGLRLEVGDRIFEAPISRLGIENGAFIRLDDEDSGEVVHELFGQLGLHLLLGVEQPRPVAVVPAPPPPAPVQPAPAAPAETPITVCVIDPTMAGGIRTVNAVFVPSTGDTLVVMNGQRTPLRTAMGNVVVAPSQSWFVAGQPLVLTAGAERLEFVTYGTARVIEAGDLALIGTVNGLPVYAEAVAVANVRQDLESAARAGQDLQTVLARRADLRNAIAGLDVLYVPVDALGCVFQPLRLVEEVRKVRG